MSVTDGPYLAAALFCDKVLSESDGVNSLIRIVDKWNIVGSAATMPPAVIQTNIFVLMRSGVHRGTSQIVITPTTPSGISLAPLVFPIVFEGDDDRGVACTTPIAFPVNETGAYWFEVSVEGTVYTNIPLRISYNSNR